MARLHVRVQPVARRTGFVGWSGDLPKFSVAERPVDGDANDAVVRLIAEVLDLRPRQVRLIGGAASRIKRVEIDGLELDEIVAHLDARVPRPLGARQNPSARR